MPLQHQCCLTVLDTALTCTASAEGYKLVIGGAEIPHIKGCEAHSDGKIIMQRCKVAAIGRLQQFSAACYSDVLLHTVTDAILGALSLPDIGKHHVSACWLCWQKQTSFCYCQ